MGGRHKHAGNRTYGSPWVDQATEQVEFFVIRDKSQVEAVLVAAQRAVLNPSRNWREYVPEIRSELPQNAGGRPSWSGKRLPQGGSWSGFPNNKRQAPSPGSNIEEDFEIKFSPNVVCMEVSLSFPSSCGLQTKLVVVGRSLGLTCQILHSLTCLESYKLLSRYVSCLLSLDMISTEMLLI